MSDELYRERAQVLALLASVWPAALSYNDPDEPDWPVLYVNSPAGQLSWHISSRDLDLFPSVPWVVDGKGRLWDGHTTEEKNQRIAEFVSKGGS